MYKFQRKFNKNEDREIFRNKFKFHKIFKEYICHKSWKIAELIDFNALLECVKVTRPERVVLKNPLGQAGSDVSVINITYPANQILVESEPIQVFLRKKINENYYLAEEYIYQHSVLTQVYPHALNTVRINSFLHDDQHVELLSAMLRIGFDKSVDNFSAGGIAALLDLNTGIISK